MFVVGRVLDAAGKPVPKAMTMVYAALKQPGRGCALRGDPGAQFRPQQFVLGGVMVMQTSDDEVQMAPTTVDRPVSPTATPQPAGRVMEFVAEDAVHHRHASTAMAPR
jgi:hypothetical protein